MRSAVAPRPEQPLWRDLAWLLGFALLVLGAGIGLRDPWPADEPRFALIARDMVHGASWLVPHIGGDLYQDKPPVFFWAIAAGYLLTGSLRVAFLLPALVSGLLAVALVWDLARRLWTREIALWTAGLLLATVQFLLQARAAQIDGFLLGLTAFSLYGLARHLLLGPAWNWYAAAGVAAGLGIATKGVGFLPLLMLLPWWALRRAGFALPAPGPAGWRWLLAPVGMLLGVALWLVPMLLAVGASGDPAHLAYRDELLFQQTVQRYANAWHHHEPPWFFLTNVIPGLWLPGTLLLPWAVPAWRRQWRERQPPALLFLAWATLVVLFFSLSSGKRGVYVLQAVPAFVLALGPLLPALLQRPAVRRVFLGTTLLIALALGAAVGWFATAGAERYASLLAANGLPGGRSLLWPLGAIAAGGLLSVAVGRLRHAPQAFAATLWVGLVVQGFWINPLLDESRSGRGFMRKVEAAVPAGVELGLVNYREQFLLQATRPVVNFGHRRWREGNREPSDAALWLNAGPARRLLVEQALLFPCFTDSPRRLVARASRTDWFLVSAPASGVCAGEGNPAAARRENPADPGAPAGNL
jgi:4-amino-4-deoxy-L-arabinose transferase-like glycosyltransferase